MLMYYGHMSKSDILHSSRPFLYGIYKKYAKRACENLGVSPDSDDSGSNTTLTAKDYPVEFKKLSEVDRQKAASKFDSEESFLGDFQGFDADKYAELKIL